MGFVIEQMRRARRDEGFTLIELLIVILILGILAGIAVFASGPFRDKATAACQDANTEIGIVANAATDAGVSGDLYAQGPGDCAGTGGSSGSTTSTTAALAAPVVDSVTLGGFGSTLSYYETATATVSTSGGAADTTTYQWASKDDGSGNSCSGGGWSDISGATGASYTPGYSLWGDYCVRVTVTVTNTAGSDTGTAVEHVG